MRDRDSNSPELRSVGTRSVGDFVEIEVSRNGASGRFRFGVSPADRATVQRVLNTRPFDAMPGLEYRRFYAGYGGRHHEGALQHQVQVRFEQGRNARTLAFDCSPQLLGSLEWFRILRSLETAAHLREPI